MNIEENNKKTKTEAIQNVIDFLQNKNSDVANEDIDIAVKCIEENEKEVTYLKQVIRDYLLKRITETYKFANILINSDLDYSEQTVLAFKTLPFKDAKNIEKEAYLIMMILDNKQPCVAQYYEYLVSDLIYAAAIVYNIDKAILDNMHLYFFHIFMPNENINFESLKTNPKINSYSAYPSEEQIDQNFELAKELYSKGYNNLTEEEQNFYNITVGQYFEKIAYEDEIKRLHQAGRPDLAQRVIWVSKEVGDGFGYDILSFDQNTKKPKLIEVKGTLSPHLKYEIILSDNEARHFYNDHNNSYIYRYFIEDDTIKRYVLTAKELEQIITDENGTNFSYEPENPEAKNSKVKIKKIK